MITYEGLAKSDTYIADGVQKSFAFAFEALSADYIVVVLNDEIVNYMDYAVTFDGSVGGTVTMDTPPAAGSRLYITLDVPTTQETDIQNNTPFLPEIVEAALDKLTLICKQMQVFVHDITDVDATGSGGSLNIRNLVNSVLKSIYGNTDFKNFISRLVTSLVVDSSSELSEKLTGLIDRRFAHARYSFRKVFDVFYSFSSSAPEGAVALEGAVVSRVAYPELFDEAVNRKKNGSIPVCTEEEYQASLSQYGECGSFVVNENAGTIRLPKIVSILQSSVTTGLITPAGIPNLKGWFTPGGQDKPQCDTVLFQRSSEVTSSNADDANSQPYRMTFDASRVSEVYRDDAVTVQPQTVGLRLYIQAYTTAVDVDTQAVIDKLANSIISTTGEI